MANNEERKQTSKAIVPSNDQNQVDSDHAIAIALQEQETQYSTTIPISHETESEDEEIEEEEEEYYSSDEHDSNDYEFFHNSNEFEAEHELLEGEGSNYSDEMEEDDDIDPDELTYEELIALGESIGEENVGMSLQEISMCLREFKFSEIKLGVDRCVVCQIEFEEDEMVVGLPCEHPFHGECIVKWLQIKKVCPICTTHVSSPKIMEQD